MAKEKIRIKTKIRIGDLVQVISGKNAAGLKRRLGDNGEVKDLQPRGKIVSINFTTGRAIVQGLNMVFRHKKRTDKNNPDSGGRIQQEAPIHLSNLMLVDPTKEVITRVGMKKVEYSKDNVKKIRRVRVSKISGAELPGGKK